MIVYRLPTIVAVVVSSSVSTTFVLFVISMMTLTRASFIVRSVGFAGKYVHIKQGIISKVANSLNWVYCGGGEHVSS